jgi:glycine cleavage system regulatory protein
MQSRVILTVAGTDRQGLVQELADAVLQSGGNWLESHLSHLAGQFVGAVLVELPDSGLGKLEQAIRQHHGTGLSVTILPVPESVPTVDGRLVTLELIGQDRPGIVREVSTALASRSVNINSFSSALQFGAWSGERLFKANLALSVPPDLSDGDLRSLLERVSGEIMVDFVLVPAAAD